MNTPTLQQIAVTEIQPSPFQHRKSFTGIDELAASIAADGVQQPLKVRRVNGHYELIFGERRWRAASVAGLATVPAFVEEMDDARAAVLLTVENDQRADLDPLERAQGYRELRDKFQLTVDQIAERVNKSKASVYAALKLAEASKPVQQALAKGETTASHAVLLARLPESAQKIAIGQHMHKRSVQDLEDWIGRYSHRSLTTAPWPWVGDRDGDAKLVPAAGSCYDCPKRAGNNRDLYPNLKAETCTDPACFKNKTQAYITAQITASNGKLLQVSTSYTGAKIPAGVLSRQNCREASNKCPYRQQAIVVHADSWEQEYIGKTTYVCTEKTCKVHYPKVPQSRPENPAIAAKRKLEEETTGRLLEELEKKAKVLTTEDYGHLAATIGCERTAGAILVACLEYTPLATVTQVAQRHKVDVAAIRKQVAAELKPKPAPPAGKVQASAKPGKVSRKAAKPAKKTAKKKGGK